MKELVKKCHSEVKEGKGHGMCDIISSKSQDWDEGQWSRRGGHLCRKRIGGTWLPLETSKDLELRLGSSGKALRMGEILLNEFLGIRAMQSSRN